MKCRIMVIEINDNSMFTLQFVDGQIIVAQDENYIEYMTRMIKEECEKLGLSMYITDCLQGIIE